MHGWVPGRVSDGSRLALCQTLSIECHSSIFFWHVYFVILIPFSSSFLCVCVFLFCSHWSLVDVPLIFFCPADHVPDWQPRILLGMVETRSVNVKKTTTTTTTITTTFTIIVRYFEYCFQKPIAAPRWTPADAAPLFHTPRSSDT